MVRDRYMFTPEARSKYTGMLSNFRTRSSWELDFIERLELHPAVSGWNYEPFAILYVNPLWPDRVSKYTPDFWVECAGRDDQEMKVIVEIKPAKQVVLTPTHGENDRYRHIVNQAKWKAAREYADRHRAAFRILTE